jgi:hypothetical protein
MTYGTDAPATGTLYNGIVLPEEWPPRDQDPASVEPMRVPHLEKPPTVIPVDAGLQLFVDDFLIESTDLTRTFHTAKKHKGNPVFKPETPAELKPAAVCYLGHGGVFYDPAERLVKMWNDPTIIPLDCSQFGGASRRDR